MTNFPIYNWIHQSAISGTVFFCLYVDEVLVKLKVSQVGNVVASASHYA
jgi:hypothetical protein